MDFTHQRITVFRMRRPGSKNINDELQWLATSLGLVGLRDRDKSCFRLFITMIKAAKNNKPLTSDELAERLNLSRGTVIHHLNKLREAGLVIHEKNNYLLRVQKTKELVEELQKDMERAFDDIKIIADSIDKGLNL